MTAMQGCTTLEDFADACVEYAVSKVQGMAAGIKVCVHFATGETQPSLNLVSRPPLPHLGPIFMSFFACRIPTCLLSMRINTYQIQ